MSRRPVFLVDMDGVIVEPHHLHLDRLNSHFDTTYRIDDITAYNYHEIMDERHARWMLEDAWQNASLYDGIDWIPGAEQGVQALRERGEVVVCSYAMVGHAQSKLNWLYDRGFTKDDVFLGHNKNRIRADLMIDDNPSFLRSFDGDRIVFDRPWNRDLHLTNVPRAYTWDDVIEFVDEWPMSGDRLSYPEWVNDLRPVLR